MALFFCLEFIEDLKNIQDPKFARRTLRKLIDNRGNFRADGDDHRYHGIEGAWIRYVSMGGPGYRAIYIRRKSDIYLYRAGAHSIEDRLKPPGEFASSHEIKAGALFDSGGVYWNHQNSSSRVLTNTKPTLLRDVLLGRRLMPHKEVTLISPFLSLSLFELSSRFGQMVQDMLQDGAKVNIITLPPHSGDVFSAYSDLVHRYGGVQLFFHSSLHAKLYIFELDSDRARPDIQAEGDLIVLGSANLTARGIGTEGGKVNEEICYRIPPGDASEALNFGINIMVSAIDFETYRVKYAPSLRTERPKEEKL